MFYVAFCLQSRWFGKQSRVLIQNSAGLNCLIGRRCLIHTDVSLEPHRGATVSGTATESNPVCLYNLPETQHCTASSVSALLHPSFPHLLPSIPLTDLWVVHVCPNIDDLSNSWPWFVELLFCCCFFPGAYFFSSLFFFLPFANSIQTWLMRERTPKGAQIKQNSVDWLRPVSPHALCQ